MTAPRGSRSRRLCRGCDRRPSAAAWYAVFDVRARYTMQRPPGGGSCPNAVAREWVGTTTSVSSVRRAGNVPGAPASRTPDRRGSGNRSIDSSCPDRGADGRDAGYSITLPVASWCDAATSTRSPTVTSFREAFGATISRGDRRPCTRPRDVSITLSNATGARRSSVRPPPGPSHDDVCALAIANPGEGHSSALWLQTVSTRVVTAVYATASTSISRRRHAALPTRIVFTTSRRFLVASGSCAGDRDRVPRRSGR